MAAAIGDNQVDAYPRGPVVGPGNQLLLAQFRSDLFLKRGFVGIGDRLRLYQPFGVPEKFAQ